MARVCCVEGCDLITKDEVTYFPFPVKQSLRRKWREAVSVGKLTTDSLICSRHFSAEDYETVRGKTRLKAKVVPAGGGGAGARRGTPSKSPQPSESSNETTNGKSEHGPSSIESRDTNNSDEKLTETISNGSMDQEVGEQEPRMDQEGGTTAKMKKNSSNDDTRIQEGSNGDEKDKENDKMDQESGEMDQESGEMDQESGNGEEINKESSINREIDKKKGCNKDRGVKKSGKTDEKDYESGKDEQMDQENGSQMDMDEGYLDQEVDFGVDDRGSTYEGSVDENGHEKCTIECVPEVVLAPDSDSCSEGEGEAHRGDIEDIIANYHIKQDKKLAERLKAGQENQESGKVESSEQESSKAETSRQQAGKGLAVARVDGGDRGDSGDECLEVEFIPNEDAQKEPVFIAFSVDRDPNRWQKEPASEGDDCMIMLEDVQVAIDPATVVPPSPERGGDIDSDSSAGDTDVELVPLRHDPISLLTSSDDDEVVIEEPHVDTVEVSDEDEDDVPLVRLATPAHKSASMLGRILWGKAYEYYCVQCHFKTLNRGEFERHKMKEHDKSSRDKIMFVCEICDFTSASKDQFARHKKKHKDEKKFKCHLCDYKAKHRMSLIYHLKSHEGVTVSTLKVGDKEKRFTCAKCRFTTSSKLIMVKHERRCIASALKMFSCDQCEYATKRRSDLRRHRARRHGLQACDEDYAP